MHILITGAAGFIGKNLWAELEAHGHSVAGADINPNLDHYVTTFMGDLHQVDLLEAGAAADLFERLRPEVVVHLAAQVGRLFGEDDIAHTVRSNALLTALVARASRAVNARLVYASTSEVYGDQGMRSCEEDGPLVLPHNLYGLSKRWGEEVAELYAPEGLVCLRLSMPYGIGVPPGRGRAALNNVLWQAQTGQPIPIHRGAERSWCWVGDTVRGIRLIIESGHGGAWNVGRDDAAVSMHELALRAVRMVGAEPSLIRLIEPPSAQTVVKRLSTERLRALGWAPQVELDEGMGQVLRWVSNYDAQGHWVGG